MIRIQDIAQACERIAPLHLQESYDNCGLLVGDSDWECTGVLCSLDITEDVVREAQALHCNCIVAHHPVIFGGIKQLNSHTVSGRAILLAVKYQIALYAIHTNLDNVYFKGVNSKIAERLGLYNTRILLPKASVLQQHTGAPGTAPGSGMIGTLAMPMPASEFLTFLKERMHSGVIRYTGYRDTLIQEVAVCGGAGHFLIHEARKAGADAYVTSDLKYHDFFLDKDDLLLADIGHFESEQFTIQLLQDIISEQFPNFAVLLTQVNTNPVNYL